VTYKLTNRKKTQVVSALDRL